MSNLSTAHTLGRDMALDMLGRLNGSQELSSACDPDNDALPLCTPMRNLLLEYVDTLLSRGSRAELEGFCEALTGHLAIVAQGGVSSVEALRTSYTAHDMRLERARSMRADVAFQGCLSAVYKGAVSDTQ